MADPNYRFTIPDPLPTLLTTEPRIREVAAPAGDTLYTRQETFNLAKPDVTIIGCGGVGVWAALSLALGGVNSLTLYDGDTLSLHNLNRFPLPFSSVGEMKSVALSNWLATLRPDIDITPRGQWDKDIHILRGNWVVCATDNLKSRKAAFLAASQSRISYLEVGADGENWSLSPSPPEFSTDLEEVAGYTVTPVHVGPCMMAGAAVAYYVLHDVRPMVSHAASWELGPELFDGARGRIRMAEAMEVDLTGREMITCPICKRVVEYKGVYLSPAIRHLRNCGHLGLAEAKLQSDELMAVARLDKAILDSSESLAEVSEAEVEVETDALSDIGDGPEIEEDSNEQA